MKETKEFYYFNSSRDDQSNEGWVGSIEKDIFEFQFIDNHLKREIWYLYKKGLSITLYREELFETENDCLKWIIEQIDEDVKDLEDKQSKFMNLLTLEPKEKIKFLMERIQKKNKYKKYILNPSVYDKDYYKFQEWLDKEG